MFAPRRDNSPTNRSGNVYLSKEFLRLQSLLDLLHNHRWRNCSFITDHQSPNLALLSFFLNAIRYHLRSAHRNITR